MAALTGPVEAGIDRRWLEEAARHDPVAHAFALWDLDHAPDRVEFHVARRRGVPVAYLLVWRGIPTMPVAHWIGDPDANELLDALPPRPLVAVVPPSVAAAVQAARAPTVSYPVLTLVRDRSVPLPPVSGRIRPLGLSDAPAVRDLADTELHSIAVGYRTAELGPLLGVDSSMWGAFDEGRLVGVARAQVRLPDVWIVGGIFVSTDYQNRGLGRAITAEAARAAEATGALAALFVRADNRPAVHAYEAIGFRRTDQRVWVDAGTQRVP